MLNWYDLQISVVLFQWIGSSECLQSSQKAVVHNLVHSRIVVSLEIHWLCSVHSIHRGAITCTLWKHTKLLCNETWQKRKTRKTTLHMLVCFSSPPYFHTFYRFFPTWIKFLQKIFIPNFIHFCVFKAYCVHMLYSQKVQHCLHIHTCTWQLLNWWMDWCLVLFPSTVHVLVQKMSHQ